MATVPAVVPQHYQSRTIGTLRNQGYQIMLYDQSEHALRFLAIHPDRPMVVRKYSISTTGRILLVQTFVHRPDKDRVSSSKSSHVDDSF